MTPERAMIVGLLVAGVIATIALGLIAAVVAPDQVRSVLGASILVLALLVGGVVGISAIIAGHPAVSMAGALMLYFLQLVLLIAGLLGLRAAGVGGPWAAASGAVTALVMQVGVVVALMRSRPHVWGESQVPS